ncbi:MAG: S-layer protein domain-containing protein [Candidatus Methanoperedens sp.]|nr:S-layer protein domain-containing protein [Candidatus Methanoperedens sp.]
MNNKITTIALAALMLLIVALPAGAVIQATSVEIRGSVATGADSWNATTFAGFWYDLKNDLKTETLIVKAITGTRDIDGSAQDLQYETVLTTKTLKVVENGHNSSELLTAFPGGVYPILGWQAQPYIAVKNNSKKLARLLIEQGNATSEKKSLTVGETWDIGDGWTLTAQSIDAKASPRQVWLVLSKDGVKLDDKVIGQGDIYVYTEKSFAGESDVPLFVTYVDSVFAGATSDMVQLRFTWAISKSVTEVKSADVFGNMEVITANNTNLLLRNKDKTVTLTKDGTVDIMGELKFRVADSDVLRYYPMVEYQVGPTTTTTGTATSTAMVNQTNQTVTETATSVATATGAVTETATPAPTATPKPTPAFESVFAIAGLLAVAFLVLRQRK